jgi:hypothetical protein
MINKINKEPNIIIIIINYYLSDYGIVIYYNYFIVYLHFYFLLL